MTSVSAFQLEEIKMSDDSDRQIKFEKLADNGTFFYCIIERFDDGSIYVAGAEFGELIYEFSSDNLERAVKHVKGLGYVECK